LAAGVLVKGNYNETAYDRTLWYALGDEDKGAEKDENTSEEEPAHLPKLANGSDRKGTPIPGSRQVQSLSDLQSDGVGGGNGGVKSVSNATTKAAAPPHTQEGFGVAAADTNGTATQFDIGIATQLREACQRHLGPTHPLLKRARIASWANHLRRLRTVDNVDEHCIEQTMGWYAEHIGQDFVPEAYAGESFRKKFFAIERQCGRDITGTVEVSTEATAIAQRLAGMGWPKGSGEAVPAAVQVCLDAYNAWIITRNQFLDKLRRDDLVNGYGTECALLLRLGEHLVRVTPSPSHFVQKWMEAVNQSVKGWEAWGGDLAPFVFRPDAQRFQAIGRGWAESFTNDPDRWDRFIEVMHTEVL